MATYRVSWEIDAEADSPEEAARQIWQEIFGRSDATPDDACLFTVDDGTGPVLIDLAEEGV